MQCSTRVGGCLQNSCSLLQHNATTAGGWRAASIDPCLCKRRSPHVKPSKRPHDDQSPPRARRGARRASVRITLVAACLLVTSAGLLASEFTGSADVTEALSVPAEGGSYAGRLLTGEATVSRSADEPYAATLGIRHSELSTSLVLEGRIFHSGFEPRQ